MQLWRLLMTWLGVNYAESCVGKELSTRFGIGAKLLATYTLTDVTYASEEGSVRFTPPECVLKEPGIYSAIVESETMVVEKIMKVATKYFREEYYKRLQEFEDGNNSK